VATRLLTAACRVPAMFAAALVRPRSRRCWVSVRPWRGFRCRFGLARGRRRPRRPVWRGRVRSGRRRSRRSRPRPGRMCLTRRGRRRSRSGPRCGRAMAAISEPRGEPPARVPHESAVNQMRSDSYRQRRFAVSSRCAEGDPSKRSPTRGGQGSAIALLAVPPALLQPPHQTRSRLLASLPTPGGTPVLAQAAGRDGARPVVPPVMRR
jgi:hypothetical protein